MRVPYGPHADQFYDLEVPDRDAAPPLLVCVHGGFWREPYGLDSLVPLAEDARRRGWATANLEYRRVGGRGGYPETFQDVADAMDDIATTDAPVDLRRVALFGHSAGGHLTLWAAGRRHLPAGAPGASPRLTPAAVVSLAGLNDLAAVARDGLGDDAAVALLDGGPDEVPERYRLADPMRLLPTGVPVLLAHGSEDRVVPLSQSTAYRDAAQAAGDPVTFQEVAGGHFRVLDPDGPAWAAIIGWLERAV